MFITFLCDNCKYLSYRQTIVIQTVLALARLTNGSVNQVTSVYQNLFIVTAKLTVKIRVTKLDVVRCRFCNEYYILDADYNGFNLNLK